MNELNLDAIESYAYHARDIGLSINDHPYTKPEQIAAWEKGWLECSKAWADA